MWRGLYDRMLRWSRCLYRACKMVRAVAEKDVIFADMVSIQVAEADLCITATINVAAWGPPWLPHF